LTVEAYLRGWVETVKPQLRHSTWRRYENLVRVHAIPVIGRHRLARLEPLDLERLYANRLAAGQSPASVHHLHAVLHRALHHAARLGLAARNVADLVDPPRLARTEMLAFDLEQSHRFLAAVASSQHEALFVVAISTGMRQGELLGLRWRDVDLGAGHLSVTTTLERPGRNPVFGEPKTRASRRRVWLTDRAIDALRRHRALQTERRLSVGESWREFDLVFTNRLGGPLDGHNVTNRFLPRMLRKAGLPAIRFHDLRHTAATLLLTKGVHPRKVADMLGHSSVAVTLDTYSHVVEGLHQDAVAALNEALG
jgi:integrase